MKQREVVKIDDKEITIKELSVKELLYLCRRGGWIDEVADIDFKGDFEKQESMDLLGLMLDFASDLSRKDIIGFAPSEIKRLYVVFVRLNETTFSVAKYLGIGKILEDTKADLIKVFMEGYSTFITSSALSKMSDIDDTDSSEPVKGELVSEGGDQASEE